MRFWFFCFLAAACGGASTPPPAAGGALSPASPFGCWVLTAAPLPDRDAVGSLYCFELDRYVVIMREGGWWDSARMAWNQTGALAWRGVPEGRPNAPVTLAIDRDGRGLALNDGRRELRLTRIVGDHEVSARRRIAELPSVEALCEKMQRCREQTGGGVAPAAPSRSAFECGRELSAIAKRAAKQGAQVPSVCEE